MNSDRSSVSPERVVKPILEHLVLARKLHLRGMSEFARPWLAAQLAEYAPGPVLWVTIDELHAEEGSLGARFYAGDAPDPNDPFGARVAFFPLHQSLPYEDLSPDRDALAERLALLFRLLHGAPPQLIVASVGSILRLGIPKAAVDSSSILILQGQTLDRQALLCQLSNSGYLNVPLVEDPGTFAVRGGIVDVFGPQLPLPVRFEFLADEVESIRTFEPSNQRTVRRLESAFLGPVREIPHEKTAVARALVEIDRLAGRLDVPSHRLLAQRQALKEGVRYFGIESLLPAFYPSLDSLFEYLPKNTTVLLDDPGGIQAAAEEIHRRAQSAYLESLEKGNLVFTPEETLVSPEWLLSRLECFQQVLVGPSEESAPEVQLRTEDVTGLRSQIELAESSKDSIAPLVALLGNWRRSGIRVFLVASRTGRALQLARMLRDRGITVRIEEGSFDPGWANQFTPFLGVRIVSGDLRGGFVAPFAGVAFLPDAEVFGHPIQRPKRQSLAREPLSLKNGALVVHVDFGIGRFESLTRLQVGGAEADYLLLAYRGGDRLYLPVTRMNLLEPYRGPEGAVPPLSKLGGKGWQQTKQIVHQALLEMADELVRMEAIRRSQTKTAIDPPGEAYQSLESSFPFEETEDQHRAIGEVVADMLRPAIMDRLVCGDVGFGKTEVAVRAAYLSVLSGFQTAVLVPTTILALQHLATFRRRLEQLAVRVEMVSRLVPAPAQRVILNDLESGKVDIIIGTHRLLREDVRFKRLRLVVIDEEHRFGVRHKERLKQMRRDADVLTMTATPLPRTLEMSMVGLRDISIIQTAPPGRRSIRTFITRFSEKVIVEAIRRERERGGQVFFLHNWVRSLAAMQRFLNRVVPEARTGIAHGQMPEGKLEQVMTAFVRREIDVLVCTSIIESGLDIPNANTILVSRADMFGLAQLYQIRGRVGRSGERAYAYLLIPGIEAITPDARKRIEVLAEFADLGSGYRIAAQDLELRGAGNLLGKKQSGHIAAVGFDLYSRLLERSVMEVRGQAATGGPEPEVNLPVAGFLPESFVPDLDQRLDLYARLSRSQNDGELLELERELVDRFGPAPQEVVNLLEIMAIKIQLRRLGILSLDTKGGRLNFQIGSGTKIEPSRVVDLVSGRGEEAVLDPAGVLKVKVKAGKQQELIPFVREILSDLSGSELGQHSQ